ncbi:hypothetical protein V6Z11_A08G079000 [Gossypium hirsutum]
MKCPKPLLHFQKPTAFQNQNHLLFIPLPKAYLFLFCQSNSLLLLPHNLSSTTISTLPIRSRSHQTLIISCIKINFDIRT